MRRYIHFLGTVVLVFALVWGATFTLSAHAAKLSFWTTEIEPKRMAIQKDLANLSYIFLVGDAHVDIKPPNGKSSDVCHLILDKALVWNPYELIIEGPEFYR